ncbi:MAG: carbohydrate ABC transporter permease [Tyzzerella sp.]|nr:carbohydrate ABC transporter permease [Tyzzerella sp.]
MKDKKMKNKKIRSRSAKQVSFIANLMCIILLILVLVPVLHVAALAFSRGTAQLAGKVYLWPVDFQIEGLKMVMTQTGFLRSLLNSIYITVVGVVISLVVQILFAYPLSRPKLKGRNFLTAVLAIAMLFSGGLVPTYMVINGLGLVNTFWAVILPGAMSTFNMLLIRNYFEGLPEGVIESAYIDGAGDLQALFKVVLPMSTPIISTVSLLTAISYWNSYFGPSIYLTEGDKMTLQVFIRNLMADTQTITEQLERTEETIGLLSVTTIQSVVTVLAAVPMIAIYPLCQRFLKQGITIGSEKG